MWKNSLIRKIRLISKFITSQPGQQAIAIHIWQSSNKIWSVNRVWHEKHFSYKIIHKIWWKILFPDIFSKKSKLSISLDQYSKVLYRLFFIVHQVEDDQYILKLSCTPLAFTSYKALFKNKKRPGKGLLVSFSVWCLK